MISLGIRSSLGFRFRIRFRVGIRCCTPGMRPGCCGPARAPALARAPRLVMMIILLLFLQKQNLAFAVYLFGSVLSSKRLFRGPSTNDMKK